MKNSLTGYLTIGIVISTLANILLWSNSRYLEQDLADKKFEMEKIKWNENYNLFLDKEYLGKDFPFDTGAINQDSLELFIVYNQTICGKCLKDQMEIINTKLSMDKKKRIKLLLGYSSENEKINLFLSLNSGRKLFSHKFIKDQMVDDFLMYNKFYSGRDTFIDTPIYFVIKSKIILDIFIPNTLDLKSFNKFITNFE